MNDEENLPSIRVSVVEEDGRARAGWTPCEIGTNLMFSAESLASYFFAAWEPVIFDALLLAAAVEFCDKTQRRPALGWGRYIALNLPVHDPVGLAKQRPPLAVTKNDIPDKKIPQ